MNLSGIARVASIKFPARPSWVPTIPDAPKIITEIDEFRAGTLKSVLPLGSGGLKEVSMQFCEQNLVVWRWFESRFAK